MPQLPQSIALHIGAHKTATTHLQKVLWHNRELLSSEGIRVYNPGYLRMKGRSLSSMFDLSWSDTPSPRREPLKQLEFLARGHQRLVFSEENFPGVLTDRDGRLALPIYPAGAKRVRELVEAWAPIKPQLFLGVRNPGTFLASAYSQALFGAAHIGPRAFRSRNDWRKVDWAAYVADLRSITAVADIYVWRQEDYEATQRLILRRLLRWKVGGMVEILPGRIHQGLSIEAVRQTLKWATEKRPGKFAGTARGLHPITDENPAFQLYNKSTLAEAAEVYDAQMAQIAKMDGVKILRPPKATAKA